jgi:hydrogenase maturation protease
MTCIIGFGNILLGDDGAGIHVINELERMGVNAELIDGGSNGMILISLVEKHDRIILVDAISSAHDIEDVELISAAELLNDANAWHFSLHGLSLNDVLSMIERVYSREALEKISIMGIRISNIEESMALSPDVEASCDKAIEILKEMVITNWSSYIPTKARPGMERTV